MTTTFYDRRAERQVASAVAEQHRADAELRRVEVEAARADLTRQERADQAEDRKRLRAERGQRRAALAASIGRARKAVPTVIGGIAMGAPVLIGWDGQLQTARTVLHLGVLAWVFPIALEGGAWWLAYLTGRAIVRNLPTGRLRLCTWLLAAIAAGMNLWRGWQAFGPIGGTGLALASLLGIGLWEITAWHQRQQAEGRDIGTVRRKWVRRLRFPRLTLAALAHAGALGETDDETAWRAAWLDRFGVGPGTTRRERKLARLVVRQQWQRDRDAAKRGDLVLLNGVILRVPAESPTTPAERAELSGTAAELLAATRAAIAVGELPERPTAYAINKRCKRGGMPAAQQVRDYLREGVA
jgi:hypothetical protein